VLYSRKHFLQCDLLRLFSRLGDSSCRLDETFAGVGGVNIAEWNASRLATYLCVSKSVHGTWHPSSVYRESRHRDDHSCSSRADARDPFRELRFWPDRGSWEFFRCRNLSTTPFVFGDCAYSDTGHREATSRGTRSNFRGSTKSRCCPAGTSTREKGRVPPGRE
jgi:hypothetical protein